MNELRVFMTDRQILSPNYIAVDFTSQGKTEEFYCFCRTAENLITKTKNTGNSANERYGAESVGP